MIGQADARRTAAQVWASALGDPNLGGTLKLASWGQYQIEMADHQYDYEVAVANLAYNRDVAVAEAEYQGIDSEAYQIAAAAETQQKEFNQQQLDWTGDLTTAFHDMRVANEDDYLDRDDKISDAYGERWAAYTEADVEREHDYLDAWYDYVLDAGLVSIHWDHTIQWATD